MVDFWEIFSMEGFWGGDVSLVFSVFCHVSACHWLGLAIGLASGLVGSSLHAPLPRLLDKCPTPAVDLQIN